MKPYTAYKQINLPWLKSIPDHWEIWRNKNIFTELKEEVGDKVNSHRLLSLTLNGIIPRDVNAGGKFPSSFEKYKIVKTGNMAFCLFDIDETPRTVGLSQYDGMLTGAYTIMRVDNINSKYAYYYYLALDNGKKLKPLYKGLRKTIDITTFQSAKLPVPPRNEQDQIVRFLDWKVSSINKLIRTKIKEINLLRELKQVLINNELLAKSNRKRVPLKRYAKSNRESLSERTPENHRIEYLDIGSVGYGYIKKKPKYYTFSEAPSRARRVVRSGDTIISTVRTYLRSVCYIDDDFDGCIVSTGFCVLTPNHQIVPEFLGFVLSSDAFINEVVRASVGTSYPAINESKLLSIKISLPEQIDEQRKIIIDLSKKLEKIDRTISYINDLIVTYEELKTRLISDVVTGQIDVRNMEIPEYEFVDEEPESDFDDVDGDFDNEEINAEA